MKYLQKPYWFFKKNRSVIYSENPRFIEVSIVQRAAYPAKLIGGRFMVLNPYYTLIGGNYLVASLITIQGNTIKTLEEQDLSIALLMYGSVIITKGDDYNAFVKKDYSSKYIEVLRIYPNDVFGVNLSEELFYNKDWKVGDRITVVNGYYKKALGGELAIGYIEGIVWEKRDKTYNLEEIDKFDQTLYIYIRFLPNFYFVQ